MVIGLHIISVAELKRFLDLKQKNEPEQTKSCRRGTMPGSMSVVILDSTMKDTPLIIYSAMLGADEINKAKEAGAQD